MDELTDILKPRNYDLDKPVQPKTVLVQTDYTRLKSTETKSTHATCNVCSTFKGDGKIRQLCGKYTCMKN